MGSQRVRHDSSDLACTHTCIIKISKDMNERIML